MEPSQIKVAYKAMYINCQSKVKNYREKHSLHCNKDKTNQNMILKLTSKKAIQVSFNDYAIIIKIN